MERLGVQLDLRAASGPRRLARRSLRPASGAGHCDDLVVGLHGRNRIVHGRGVADDHAGTIRRGRVGGVSVELSCARRLASEESPRLRAGLSTFRRSVRRRGRARPRRVDDGAFRLANGVLHSRRCRRVMGMRLVLVLSRFAARSSGCQRWRTAPARRRRGRR